MASLLVYLFCFVILFFICKQNHKILCFIVLCLLSSQLVFSYYSYIGKIQDILFYLITLSVIDLLMVACVIVNNFIVKDYRIVFSLFAILAVFSTLLSIFDFYRFYYFQYAPMFVVEYLYFSIRKQEQFTTTYYALSLLLIIPHIIT